MGNDDHELARLSRSDRAKSAGRLPDPPSGPPPAWLGRVTTASASVVAGKFFMARPLSIVGTESEGSSGTAADQGTVDRAVYLIGPGKPSQNDQVVVSWADWRWVASRRATVAGTCTINRTYSSSCTGARAGLAVSLILGGVTIATGTTNGSGLVTFTGLSPGTYTLTTPAATGYGATSTTVTLATCPTTSTATVTVPVGTGWICCGTAPNQELIEVSRLPATLTYARRCTGSNTTSPNATLTRNSACTWSLGFSASVTYLGGGVFQMGTTCGVGWTATGIDIYAINITRTFTNCCGTDMTSVDYGDLEVTITP